MEGAACRRSVELRRFSGGELNTCYNAIDYHAEHGRADQLALIYDSLVTGTRHTFTYSQLLDQVTRFAGVLALLSVAKRDRVIIYMPMTPKALIAMYACARIGAIHSVVFGGFAARELAVRIEDAAPADRRVQAAARPRARDLSAPAGRPCHRVKDPLKTQTLDWLDRYLGPAR